MNTRNRLKSGAAVVGTMLLLVGVAISGTVRERFEAFILDDGANGNKNEDRIMANISFECIACHDGSIGSDVTVSSMSDRKSRGWDAGMSDHPVGMDYMSSYMKSRGGLFAPQSLPAEVILVDGKVTCLSCHKLKDRVLQRAKGEGGGWGSSATCTSSKETTVASGGSRLCISCHSK